MTDYPFEGQLVADPVTFQRATNGQIYVYDASDTTNSTPLALKDTTGNPLPNPLPSSADAFTRPFYAPVEDIKLVGAGLTVFMSSAKGMRDAAAASASAAQSAADSATTAAGNTVASAAVDSSGALLLQKANGAPVNAGVVKGAKGDKGDKGADGANVLPTDDAIEQATKTAGTKTATALSATYATVPKPVKNPLTGYYHVKGFGGIGNGTTTNDAVVNPLIAQVIANGGGTVYFDDDATTATPPVYRLDQMIINGKGNINLEIKAAPNLVIKPAPLSTTDFIVISSGSTSTTDGTFLRRLRLTDLVIQSQGQSMSGTNIDRRAITISQAQDITLRNVKIAGFKRGGLILTDVLDSYFNDVEIQWCGYGTDNANYAHALQFLGSLDNSNNNRFVNLHMEHCPLMMLFDGNSRQNKFIGWKFEDGTETEKNTSTISPFYFKQAIENEFAGPGHISVDYTSDVPVIRTDDNTNSYLTTYNVRQANKWSNCLFFANSLNKARWYSGYNTEFNYVTCQRTNGATGGYGFDFASRNAFRGGSITFADNNSNGFRIQGDNNVLDKATLVTFGDGAGAGTTGITLSSGATRNDLDWIITGPIGSEFTAGPAFGTAGTLGNNFIRCERDNNATTSGGGQKNALHKWYLKLTDTSAATYTGFLNGYTGQRLTIFATTANVTLQHGNTANATAMKSGANKTLAANETITFQTIDGVWREI